MASFPEPTWWNGDEPDPIERSTGEAYSCLVCGWLGIGGASAYAHHKEAHHAIGLTYWPGAGPISFGCCPGRKQSNSYVG